MATTVTGSLAAGAIVPRYIEEGPITLGGRIVVSHTLSDGLEFHFCKIPHGAHIVDGWFHVGLSNGAAEFNFGIMGESIVNDEDALVASQSSSTDIVFRFEKNLPLKVSVSDNARNRFAFLTATVGDVIPSSTASGTLAFNISYVFDL